MEGAGQWPLLIMMFLAFYLILIVPQTRRAKKEKKFINALKRGDRVVTKSGMHGKVLEVNDQNNTCVLETMAGKIKFDKTAISLETSEDLCSAAFKFSDLIFFDGSELHDDRKKETENAIKKAYTENLISFLFILLKNFMF